jgi:AAA+ ATPase superfamily predicted ATPase
MTYCDTNINILEWGSEEVYMWYRSPVDNRAHRYFPDFYIKVREKDGTIKKYIIEVKPQRQTKPPARPKRQTKGYLREAFEYAKNQAKWKAANEWCLDRGFEFKVITEKELGIK